MVVGSLRRVARAGSRRGKRASAPSREAPRRGRAAPAQFRAPAAGIARSPVAGGIFSLAPRPRPRPRRSFGENAREDRFTQNWPTDLVHLRMKPPGTKNPAFSHFVAFACFCGGRGGGGAPLGARGERRGAACKSRRSISPRGQRARGRGAVAEHPLGRREKGRQLSREGKRKGGTERPRHSSARPPPGSRARPFPGVCSRWRPAHGPDPDAPSGLRSRQKNK